MEVQGRPSLGRQDCLARRKAGAAAQQGQQDDTAFQRHLDWGCKLQPEYWVGTDRGGDTCSTVRNLINLCSVRCAPLLPS